VLQQPASLLLPPAAMPCGTGMQQPGRHIRVRAGWRLQQTDSSKQTGKHQGRVRRSHSSKGVTTSSRACPPVLLARVYCQEPGLLSFGLHYGCDWLTMKPCCLPVETWPNCTSGPSVAGPTPCPNNYTGILQPLKDSSVGVAKVMGVAGSGCKWQPLKLRLTFVSRTQHHVVEIDIQSAGNTTPLPYIRLSCQVCRQVANTVDSPAGFDHHDAATGCCSCWTVARQPCCPRLALLAGPEPVAVAGDGAP